MKEHVIPSTSAASCVLFNNVSGKSIPNIDSGDSDFDSVYDIVVKMLVLQTTKLKWRGLNPQPPGAEALVVVFLPNHVKFPHTGVS